MNTVLSDTNGLQVFDYSVKLLIIGDLSVGKSALLNAYEAGRVCASGSFPPSQRECQQKTIELCGKRLLLKIWDTRGQEKYRSLTASYYRGAHGCLILFDVTNLTTFENVQTWYDDLMEYSSASNVQIILVGVINTDREREVPRERGEKYGIGHNLPYMEVDIKNDKDSVNTVMNKLLYMIIKSAERHSTMAILPVNVKGKQLAKTCCSCC
ncbi:hypothetical protein SNE40_003111 [Patella caerulea]|uniref:Uncharacterized protein n=1 Tax=Patella caerulea TaxID=87958 RepID=A0AAN8Q880_PATCE